MENCDWTSILSAVGGAATGITLPILAYQAWLQNRQLTASLEPCFDFSPGSEKSFFFSNTGQKITNLEGKSLDLAHKASVEGTTDNGQNSKNVLTLTPELGPPEKVLVQLTYRNLAGIDRFQNWEIAFLGPHLGINCKLIENGSLKK